MTKSYSTFICYRRKEDSKFPVGSYIARIIYEYLSKEGISVCYDVESFSYGSNYIEETTRIIENQIRCFILILTPRTLERCIDKDVDPVYNELMIALSKYRKEKNDSSIVESNRFRFIVINPDSLFDYNECIPQELDSQIKELISNTHASKIHFCEDSFRDDIKRTLLSVIIETLSFNSIDQINNKFGERKRDLIDSNFSTQKTFIDRLVEKFLKLNLK